MRTKAGPSANATLKEPAVSHLRLNFRTLGDTRNPHLLLVHGFLSCNLQWLPNQEYLAKRYRLIMVEIWGHGSSPIPEDLEAYSATSYIEQLESIRAELGIERWGVVGHSLGAGIVLNYALSHPQRLVGGVITNSRSALGEFTETLEQISEDLFQDLRSLPMHPIHYTSLPGDLSSQLIEAADTICPKTAYSVSRMVHTLSCRSRLGDLEVPFLLCNGIREKSFQADITYVEQHARNLKTLDMNAGHSPNLDTPAEFNQAVHTFFASLSLQIKPSVQQ